MKTDVAKRHIAPRMSGLLLNELPLKALSLVIAVSLFAFVRGDKQTSMVAYVKVLYTLPTDRVLIAEPVGELRVTLHAPAARLQHFDERSLEPVQIDLRQNRLGKVRFSDDMLHLPPGFRISSLSPETTSFEMTQRVVRERPIEPIIEGQPADGYRVTKITAVPATIRVEGAKSVVNSLGRIPTAPLKLNGAKEPVSAELSVESLPAHADYLDPARVLVRVEVQPALVERTLDALPIRIVGPSRLRAKLDPPQARLLLRGPADLLAAVRPERISLSVNSQLVDASHAGRFVRSVVVNGLMPGVQAEVHPDTVMLSIAGDASGELTR